MATNSIETVDIFQKVLDEQMVRELTSIRMERNASMIKYDGGKTVKIPSITMDGLGDYSTSTGFPEGDVTLSYESHTLEYDRGRGFSLDALEVDESGFMATAGNVMGQFQRTKVVPEIDAARYSRIWGKANTDLRTEAYTPDAATILTKISDAIEDMQDVVGGTEALTIYIGLAAYKALKASTGIDKRFDVTDFTRGDVKLKVKTLDEIPLISVPSVRFKTVYTFGDDGFAVTAVSMAMNFMLVADRALLAINKLEKTRVFDPTTNQDADAWKMQYRRHHDLLIPNNKLEGVFISYTAIDAPELAGTFAKGTGTGNTKFTLETSLATGETMFYKLGAAASTVKYNDVPSGFTTYVSGADIVAEATQYLAVIKVVDGHVTELADSILTGLISTGA